MSEDPKTLDEIFIHAIKGCVFHRHPDCIADGCVYSREIGMYPEHTCHGKCQNFLRSDGPEEPA